MSKQKQKCELKILECNASCEVVPDYSKGQSLEAPVAFFQRPSKERRFSFFTNRPCTLEELAKAITKLAKKFSNVKKGHINMQRKKNPDKPKISKEEFEKQYAERSALSVGKLRMRGISFEPCDCGDEICQGWQAVLQGMHWPT